MAVYTETLYEWLQREAYTTQDVFDPDDLDEIVRRTIFSPKALSHLDPEIQQLFPIHFAYHYMDDEIVENEAYFKGHLTGRIITNAAEINLIYRNLYKQFYAEYELTHKTEDSKRKILDNTLADKSNKRSYDDRVNNDVWKSENTLDFGTHNNSTQATSEEIRDLKDKSNDFGFEHNNDTALNHKVKDSEYVNNGNAQANSNYNDHEQKVGDFNNNTHYNNFKGEREYIDYQEKLIHNTTDVMNYDSTIDDIKRGYVNDRLSHKTTVNNNRKYEDVHEKGIAGSYVDDVKNRHDENGMAFAFDTPQGSLEGLRDPDGQPGGSAGNTATTRGIGFVGADNRKYNYFSDARENDASAWDTNKGARTYGKDIEGNDSAYKETTKDKYNVDGENNYDRNISEVEVIDKSYNITGKDAFGDDVNFNYKGDIKLNNDTARQHKLGDDTRNITGDDTKEFSGKIVDSKSGEEILTNDHRDNTNADGSANSNSQFKNDGNSKDDVLEDNSRNAHKTVDMNNVSSHTGKLNNEALTEDNGTNTNRRSYTTDNREFKNTVGQTVDVGNQSISKDIDTDMNSVGDIERFKIDFTKWLVQPKYMDKLWAIFNTLFQWVLN